MYVCTIITHKPLNRFASNLYPRTRTDMGLVLKRKIAKIVIYYEAQVNGESKYEYPGQRWVPKLVIYIFVFFVSLGVNHHHWSTSETGNPLSSETLLTISSETHRICIEDPSLIIGNTNPFVWDPKRFFGDPKFVLVSPKFSKDSPYFNRRSTGFVV